MADVNGKWRPAPKACGQRQGVGFYFKCERTRSLKSSKSLCCPQRAEGLRREMLPASKGSACHPGLSVNKEGARLGATEVARA